MKTILSRRQVTLAALGTSIAIMFTTPNAYASESTNEVTLSSDVIRRADQFVSLHDVEYFFDANSAQQVLSAKEIERVKSKILQMNSQIQDRLNTVSEPQRVIVSTTSKKITVIEDTTNSLSTYQSSTYHTLNASYHEGVTKVEYGWYGVRIYLSRSTLRTAVKYGATIGGIFVSSTLAKAGLAILGLSSDYIPGGVVIESNIAEAVLLRIGRIYWQ